MGGATEEDDYATKLVKYIPGEVLAFFLPAVAVAGTRPDLQWAAALIGLLATGGYLYVYNKRKKLPTPKVWYVSLAMIAFIAWALGTSAPTRELVGMDDVIARFILLVAVLVIPGIDEWLS